MPSLIIQSSTRATNRDPNPANSRDTSICSGVSMRTLSVHCMVHARFGKDPARNPIVERKPLWTGLYSAARPRVYNEAHALRPTRTLGYLDSVTGSGGPPGAGKAIRAELETAVPALSPRHHRSVPGTDGWRRSRADPLPQLPGSAGTRSGLPNAPRATASPVHVPGAGLPSPGSPACLAALAGHLRFPAHSSRLLARGRAHPGIGVQPLR